MDNQAFFDFMGKPIFEKCFKTFLPKSHKSHFPQFE
jgi:hypothetical protein